MNVIRNRASLAVAVAMATIAVPALAQGDAERLYPAVTDKRLVKPEAQNWLQYRGTYNGWGYSPLKQINDKNVGKMQLAWSFNTGALEGHQSPPIVNGDYMYITTPGNQIIALDPKTGQEIWRYKKELPGELMQLHPTNRGVALYGDKLYMATVDCMLVALDAKSGKLLWSKPVGDWKAGYYMTLAPLAAKGKIMVGVSGGEFGVRGYVAAHDSETGEQAWKTYTVAAPGEPGGDTWPGDSWKTGGGGPWITGTYDPAVNIAYWGTGNPSPWPPEPRKGDNLYTTSTIALDVDTGKITGHHQYTPNDAWDWDEVSAPLLIDTEHKGKKIKGAIRAGRNGYLWVLNRNGGKLEYVNAWPYVHNNVIKSLDPKTGRPTYDPTKTPGFHGKSHYCPSLWGGKDWVPESYSPESGLFYIPANNNMCAELPKAIEEKYKPGDLWIGYPLDGVIGSLRVPDPKQTIGELQAWDVKTGKLAWVHKFKTFLWTPLMSTGGNLVFAGGTNDRKFRAFNAKTGAVLWEFVAPSGVTGVPSSFEVAGEQYVAVQAGWGVDAERMQGAINNILPDRKVVVPQGGTLLVFKVPKNGK